jgi:MFS superfamily sulfate permease-like transporter
MKNKFQFEDLRAGLVVALVALPLCLGIALASGNQLIKVPLISGLFAGVIGGLVVGSLSNSRLSVAGPAAGLTLIVASALTTLGSYHALMAAVVVAGAMQVVLGLIHAGVIANYLPSAAIKGMLCGIGIILIIKQVPHFFGYDKDPEGDLGFFQVDGENSFSELINAINYICPPSFIIALISVTVLIMWEKKFVRSHKVLSMIPGPLVVVVLGILLDFFFSQMGGIWDIAPEHMVNFPSVLEAKNIHEVFYFPDLNAFGKADTYKVAMVIAAVASVETLLCIEAIDKLDPEKHNTSNNRELMAQGAGNMISGLIGGLPITSVIVRSSVNLNSGAKTKMATIAHGLFLASAVLFIPGILKMIPMSALAAILIVTGYKLARVSIFKNAYRQGWKYFLPFIFTILVMLATDLLKGVGCGIIISFIFLLAENMQMPFKVGSEKIDGMRYYLVQVAQHVTFLHKGSFVNLLEKIPAHSWVTIDARKTTYMDRDVTELLNEFKRTAKSKNIKLELLNVAEVEIIEH